MQHLARVFRPNAPEKLEEFQCIRRNEGEAAVTFLKRLKTLSRDAMVMDHRHQVAVFLQAIRPTQPSVHQFLYHHIQGMPEAEVR
jgi:hypothetical protein